MPGTSNVGPMPGASQTVGGSTLPSNPTPRQIFMVTSGGTPNGLYICFSAGTWTLVEANTGAGTVTSVTGTANQISVATGTTTPVLSFPSGAIISENFVSGLTSTATAAGTTVLTVASKHYQVFTGSTTQTITLPVVSTLLQVGFSFDIQNDSSGALTVNSSGGNLVKTMDAGTRATFTCKLLTGTSAASWNVTYTVSTSPGGSDTQIQFNNAGSFGGVAGLTWVAPTVLIAGATTTGPDVEAKITGDTFSRIAMGINVNDVARIGFGPGSGARDAFIEYKSAGNIKFGGTDSATPIAQVSSVQSVIAGTSNTAGVDRTFAASQGTGTQTSGRHIFQIGIAGSTGTAVNALENKFIVGPTGVTVSVGETTSALTDLLINPTTKASGNLLDLQKNGVSQFSVSSAGVISGLSGFTYDGSGGNLTVSGTFVAGSTSYLRVSTRLNISASADGVALLQNAAVNDFTRLNLGGTTSSFPALGRSTTRLTVGLADGTAGGGINFSTASVLSIASGTNQRAGNATLVGGTITVSNTTVTANTVVMLTRKTSGGTIGTAITYTLSAGTSFTVNSDNILDTSTFSYVLIEVP